MNETLSVVVPVFNVQHSLATEVHELLEVLSDLASRFELLLVDDGSTDHTGEQADELARQFPQIRIVRHARRSGASAAVQSGLRHATGDFVFVQDEFTPVSSTALRRLWESRSDQRSTDARSATPGAIDSGLLRRLSDWGAALQRQDPEHPSKSGIRMVPRPTGANLRRRNGRSTR